MLQDNKNVPDDLTEPTSRTENLKVNSNNGSGSLGVHILSASGNNIIAVANPALALSPTLVKPLNIKQENLTD